MFWLDDGTPLGRSVGQVHAIKRSGVCIRCVSGESLSFVPFLQCQGSFDALGTMMGMIFFFSCLSLFLFCSVYLKSLTLGCRKYHLAQRVRDLLAWEVRCVMYRPASTLRDVSARALRCVMYRLGIYASGCIGPRVHVMYLASMLRDVPARVLRCRMYMVAAATKRAYIYDGVG